MLWKYNNRNCVVKPVIDNIEELFSRDKSIMGCMYRNLACYEILVKFEGMKGRHGAKIITNDGEKSLEDCSTDTKLLLLAATYYDDFTFNVKEIGEEALEYLSKIAQRKDIAILVGEDE